MTADAVDRRVARTRAALDAAFLQLLFSRNYNDITTADIAAQADISRSTFYEHYKSKDDLLRHSLSGPFAAFAEIVVTPSSAVLLPVLAHFVENRVLARVVFAHPVRLVLSRCLADMIEAKLAILARPPQRPVIPLRLIALQLAEAQLAIVENWITGKVAAQPTAIADALVLSTEALVTALLQRKAIR